MEFNLKEIHILLGSTLFCKNCYGLENGKMEKLLFKLNPCFSFNSCMIFCM